MIEAEEKLAKAGLIKTDEERAEFRNGISTAEDINSYTGKLDRYNNYEKIGS